MTEGEEIGLTNLPEALLRRRHTETGEKLSVPMLGDIKAIERNVIQEVIERCRGNKAAAARALGMHRRTLYRKLAVGSE
jgi:ActR/RegA family two-component response regulator